MTIPTEAPRPLTDDELTDLRRQTSVLLSAGFLSDYSPVPQLLATLDAARQERDAALARVAAFTEERDRLWAERDAFKRVVRAGVLFKHDPAWCAWHFNKALAELPTDMVIALSKAGAE